MSLTAKYHGISESLSPPVITGIPYGLIYTGLAYTFDEIQNQNWRLDNAFFMLYRNAFVLE